MKRRVLLVAIAASQLATAAAVGLRRVGHQEGALQLPGLPGLPSLPAPPGLFGLPNVTNSTNSTNATLPKCDFKKDGNGVFQPAYCASNTSDSCSVIPNKTFSDFNCTPPVLATCQKPDFGELYAGKVSKSEEDQVDFNHSTQGSLACVEDAAPVDAGFSNQTWGEKWYKGPKAADVWCNNGTWTKPKKDFTCAPLSQIMMLKDLEHYLRWTEEKLRIAEGIDYKWIDSTAATRKSQLYESQRHAHRMLLEAAELELPSVDDMKIVLKVLKDDCIVPKGEPMSEETCKDLQSVFSSATVPGRTDKMPGFSCAYTQQKVSTGYNHVVNEIDQTRHPTFFFRDGCVCESRWAGGCPFQLHYKKPFKQFGFANLDVRTVSKHAGAAGANALCWYWADSAHPEWGYLNRGKNV